MTHWQWVHSNERKVIRIQRRTFNRNAIDRIWPVENDNSDVLPFACAHRQIHCPDEGVIARADVLQVNQQKVDVLQHLARRFAMFAIQTVNRDRKSRMLVTAPFNHVVLSFAAIPVLRAKERAQLEKFPIFAREDLRSMPQLRIH